MLLPNRTMLQFTRITTQKRFILQIDGLRFIVIMASHSGTIPLTDQQHISAAFSKENVLTRTDHGVS